MIVSFFLLIDEISILRARDLLKKPPSYPKWSLLPSYRLGLPFVGRDKLLNNVVLSAESTFAEFTTAFATREALDRKKVSFPAFFVSAGRGKTRFAVELGTSLGTATAFDAHSLRAVVPLSFAEAGLLAYETMLQQGKASADLVMGALLLAGYLRCHLSDVPLISVSNALDVLRNHQNSTTSSPSSAAEPLRVFVLIDEVNYAKPEHVSALLKALVTPNFESVRNKAHFVYPVLFGTHTMDQLLQVHISGCYIKQMDLPLLTAEDVAQMLERVAQQSSLQQQQLLPKYRLYGAWKKTQAFQQLIADAGGWPRGLDVILLAVTTASGPMCTPVEELDFTEISYTACDQIRTMYRMVSDNPLTLPTGALLYILTGLPVEEPTALISNSEKITFSDLATRRALAVLRFSAAGYLRLEAPFLWLRALIQPHQAEPQSFAPLQSFWSILCEPASPILGWDGFESVCAAFLSLRLNCFRRSSSLQVPLRQLLHGAQWVKSNAPPLLFQLQLPSASDDHIVRLSRRFPCGSVKFRAHASPLAKSFLLKCAATNTVFDIRTEQAQGRCFVNAPGAPFADVVLSLWHDGSNKPYLVLLQQKFYKSTTVLCCSDIQKEYNKCATALHKCAMEGSFAGWTLVVITTAPTEDIAAYQRWSLLPNTYLGVVSQANFSNFFGVAFASRAVFAAKLDRSLNSLCAADIQQLTGVTTPSISDKDAIELFPQEDRNKVRRKLNFRHEEEKEEEEEEEKEEEEEEEEEED